MPVVKRQTVKKKTAKRRMTGKRSILDQLPDAWDMQDRITMCLYGRSGSGKTTFWSSFPGPMLAIITSGGSKPGELRSINTPALRKKITARVVTSSTQLGALLAIAEDFETVVLEHATGLQDLKMREILGIERLPAQMSWGVASQTQWGQLGLQMKETLREFLSLPKNVIIVTQERDFTPDEDRGVLMPYVAGALMPSVVGWLNPACDYVSQMYIREEEVDVQVKMGKKTKTTRRKTGGVEYCLRTAPSAVFASKFRAPKTVKLPECIVDPTYDKMLKLIESFS